MQRWEERKKTTPRRTNTGRLKFDFDEALRPFFKEERDPKKGEAGGARLVKGPRHGDGAADGGLWNSIFLMVYS